MGYKPVLISDIASINARQYSNKEQWPIIRYLDTGNVTKGKIGAPQVLDTSADKVPSRARRKVKNASIVFSMVRPNQEHHALLDYPPDDMLVSTGFSVIDADKSKVVPDYLYYALTTKEATEHFQALAEQSVSTYPTLGIDDLASFKIELPNIDVQRRVSFFLRMLDKKIASNEQINDYLAELADFYFKEMFNSLEANAQLSDITEVTMGQSPVGTSYNEEGKGVVFYQGRGEFGWRYPTQRLFTTEPKRMALKGDVLMSVRAPVGDLNVAFEDCCIGRGLAAIHSDHRSYVLYLMRSLKTQLDAFNGEGTVFGSINGKALKAFPIALPTITAINEFESFAKPIDKSIRYNVQENRELEKLRDSLLPKLMSGEIDVSRVDITQLNNHLAESP